MRFNGPEYNAELDSERLGRQHERIRELMKDQKWRTLQDIALATGYPAASISAQLRHLRKERFGAWVVERRPRGNREKGLFEYRVLPPKQQMDFIDDLRPKKEKCPHCKGTGYTS